MTIHQLNALKPFLNIRAVCGAAGLSQEAVAAKLYRYGVQGRKSELTAPEGNALDRALTQLFRGAGIELARMNAQTATRDQHTETGEEPSR